MPTCCMLLSPSVCFKICDRGLEGTAHSAPDMRPWSDIEMKVFVAVGCDIGPKVNRNVHNMLFPDACIT